MVRKDKDSGYNTGTSTPKRKIRLSPSLKISKVKDYLNDIKDASKEKIMEILKEVKKIKTTSKIFEKELNKVKKEVISSAEERLKQLTPSSSVVKEEKVNKLTPSKKLPSKLSKEVKDIVEDIVEQSMEEHKPINRVEVVEAVAEKVEEIIPEITKKEVEKVEKVVIKILPSKKVVETVAEVKKVVDKVAEAVVDKVKTEVKPEKKVQKMEEPAPVNSLEERDTEGDLMPPEKIEGKKPVGSIQLELAWKGIFANSPENIKRNGEELEANPISKNMFGTHDSWHSSRNSLYENQFETKTESLLNDLGEKMDRLNTKFHKPIIFATTDTKFYSNYFNFSQRYPRNIDTYSH